MDPNAKKRKVRQKPRPYPPRIPKDNNVPKTSAIIPLKHKKEFLTNNDWLMIIDFCDKNPGMKQVDIPGHFAKRPEGALLFTQGTLSKHLSKAGREKLKAKIESSQVNALDTKRERVVTRPDVELACLLWCGHMEEKGETVNGPMLSAKRAKLEAAMGVPVEERMKSLGWIAPFCKAYGLKEYRRHGEAGSVNVVNVEIERKRLTQVLSLYKKCDRFNLDETGLFGFAPPDRGLATKQMSGKKATNAKMRITIAFACNADGSEVLKPFFIGKSKKPVCFGKRTPAQRGFYYRNNKTAWMTAALFEEWIRIQDRQFRSQNRQICLLVDNFAGHIIVYRPTNIRIEFLAPNMTSHIQPLDAGIIRCFKAHYRRAFCLRALELDDAGQSDIYKINLLEVMLMADEAWRSVTAVTRRNCWDHTRIQNSFEVQRESTVPVANRQHSTQKSPLTDQDAWQIIMAFAQGTDGMTLPHVEAALELHLKENYKAEHWKPAFDAVFAAEDDEVAAVESVHKLMETALRVDAETADAPMPADLPLIPEVAELEKSLLKSVDDLRKRNRVHGTALTLEEMLNPIEEQEVGSSGFQFPEQDDEEVIIAEVYRRMNGSDNAETSAGATDLDDNDKDDDDCTPDSGISASEGMSMCEQMEKLCLAHSDAEGIHILELQQQLRRMRGHLRRIVAAAQKQGTLDSYFQQPMDMS